MITSSNGNIFRVTGPLCADSLVTGEFPHKGQCRGALIIFFDLCLNKRLSKHSWGCGFDTPSCPLWHHCNGYEKYRGESDGRSWRKATPSYTSLYEKEIKFKQWFKFMSIYTLKVNIPLLDELKINCCLSNWLRSVCPPTARKSWEHVD